MTVAEQIAAIQAAGHDHKHDWLWGEHWSDPVSCSICGVGGLDLTNAERQP